MSKRIDCDGVEIIVSDYYRDIENKLKLTDLIPGAGYLIRTFRDINNDNFMDMGKIHGHIFELYHLVSSYTILVSVATIQLLSQ